MYWPEEERISIPKGQRKQTKKKKKKRRRQEESLVVIHWNVSMHRPGRTRPRAKISNTMGFGFS